MQNKTLEQYETDIEKDSIFHIQIWMTVKEAATYLRISEPAFRTLICRNSNIPRYKLGRSTRLKKDDLDKLLESSCLTKRRHS